MKSYAPPKLRQIVTEAVFRRKRVFLWAFCVVMAVVSLATFLMPKKYAAEAKLMVQNVRSQAPLSTSPSDRLVQQDGADATEINGEVDLLESNGVARRALGQDANTPVTKAEDAAIRDFQRRLTVDAVHQTDLINLRLLAGSPEEASAELQQLLDAYFQARATATRSSGAQVFFEGQVEDVGKQLDEEQKALAEFEVKHQIADLDDQKKLQQTRVATLHDQLATANGAVARQESQMSSDKRQLSLTPDRTATVERTITNQYSQERLNTSLVDLENKRSELMKRYQPADRQIVEINEQIATTRAAINAATTSPATETATDVNPVWLKLRTDVAVATGELSGLEAQRAEFQQQLKEAQVRLDELEQATEPFQALKRKLDETQVDYNLYAQRRDEARVSQALDKEKMLDAALVQPPLASPLVVRPKPALYMGAGLVAAVLLGMLLALYADNSADQVYTPVQLDALTGMRTLATFAEAEGAERNALEYRRLLFAIRSALGEKEGEAVGRCVAFTSALSGEGVTYLADNLATEGSRQSGTRIAVLDMRALLKKFELEKNVSFGMRYDESKQHWVLALDDSGSRYGTMLRQGVTHGQFTARLAPLLREARKEFDLMLLDCPSFQESTLAGELDICVDGYIAVVSAGMARKQNLEQMAAVLRESRAPLVGYALNRRQYPVPGWVHRLI